MTRPAARLHGLEAGDDSLEVSLTIGRRELRIGYTADGVPLAQRYEPFLAAALPIAMARARSLSIEAPISPRLLDALPEIQRLLERWGADVKKWGSDQGLRAVDIEADRADPPARAPGRGTAAFFSGGVDSFYTVLEDRDAIDAVVYVHGFDVPLDDRAKRERVIEGLAGAAAALDLPLIELETDLRSTSNRICRWGLYHGAALASVAHLLAPHFERVLIPASYTTKDGPWGSHPQLDPLWTTESVEIVHDRPIPRVEKVARLTRSDVAMSALRVCWQDTGDYNCGHCEKCLRTMASLRLHGALERCATFPDHLPLRLLSETRMHDELVLSLGRQNLELAESLGTDPALTKALRTEVRRNSRRLARQGLYRKARARAAGLWAGVRTRGRRLRAR